MGPEVLSHQHVHWRGVEHGQGEFTHQPHQPLNTISTQCGRMSHQPIRVLFGKVSAALVQSHIQELASTGHRPNKIKRKTIT